MDGSRKIVRGINCYLSNIERLFLKGDIAHLAAMSVGEFTGFNILMINVHIAMERRLVELVAVERLEHRHRNRRRRRRRRTADRSVARKFRVDHLVVVTNHASVRSKVIPRQ